MKRLRDRFELLVPLGSGGFGTVWEGFDMLLERPVAIKRIELSTKRTDSKELALREARATARLNHPGIVSLYEVVHEDGTLYLVSELVHGQTLAQLLEEGLLSDRDVAVIGAALCEALAHAHRMGVVHRDVKPANVMVPREWCEHVSGWRAQPAKLMDFGIASVAEGNGGADILAGSWQYMAPEQARGDAVSPATDVYAFSAVMYECFVGQPPEATGADDKQRRRDSLAWRRPDLPPVLSEAIDRGLDPDPVFRPATEELVAVLHSVGPQLTDALDRPSWLRALSDRFASATRHESVQPAARIASATVFAALTLALSAAVGQPQTLLLVAIAAAVGLATPRFAPALFSLAATAALLSINLPGAAVLAASSGVLATLASARGAEAVARGALAAWWLLLLGAMSQSAVLLLPPAGIASQSEVLSDASAGFETLFALLAPVALATVGLWALAAFALRWVTGGPRRLGLLARASIWVSAFAALQLAIVLLLGAQLGTAALAITVVAITLALITGFTQWHSGRVIADTGNVFAR
ncbi:MAG: serine/threonine protein kinase [Thermoleophilaceae bacterium]|nr:serine/threonine protein kinase [Thermoleophilaceae bacterium]